VDLAFILALLAVGAVAFPVLRRIARRPGNVEREARVRGRLTKLAEECGLTVEAGPTDGSYFLSGALGDLPFRVEPGTRGMPFDGDSVVCAACPLDATVVVWPRDAPDEVTEGLGEERPTRDEQFDARFSVFASSDKAPRRVLDETVRAGLFELGIVALVLRDREAMLLLPGIPSTLALQKAAELLAAVVARSV
jgi:hypothetical protein